MPKDTDPQSNDASPESSTSSLESSLPPSYTASDSAASNSKSDGRSSGGEGSRRHGLQRGLAWAAGIGILAILLLAFWGGRDLYLTFLFEPSEDEIPVVVERREDGSVLLTHRHSVGHGTILLVREEWPGEVTVTYAADGSIRVTPGGTRGEAGTPPAPSPGAASRGAASRGGDTSDGGVPVAPPQDSGRAMVEPGNDEDLAPGDAAAPEVPSSGVATTPSPEAAATDLETLRQRGLAVPVRGVTVGELADTFGDPRGQRQHRAIDILAPRGTPVLAADDGVVTRIFENNLGGLSLYQQGPEGRYIYYYAHLDGYAPTLAEDMPVQRGRVLGYVGTTGNAPENTPHLHFAIHRIDDPSRPWRRGAAINPYEVYREP